MTNFMNLSPAFEYRAEPIVKMYDPYMLAGRTQMITLRSTTTKSSFVSGAIRLLTWSDFSHVEFKIPNKGYLGAHFDGGVQLRPFDYDPKCEFKYGYVLCPVEVEQKVLALATEQIGKPYDTTAILGILLHRDWKERDSWFCSELVEYCFEAAGYPLLNDGGKLNRITPRDVMMSPLVRMSATLMASENDRRGVRK